MEFYKDQFYHLYNRSINNEVLFSSDRNYIFFLDKYRKLENYLDTLAFCLMPTHFHFLARIKSDNQDQIRRAIGDLLSGYSKAINKERKRRGSLFQQHTKSKQIKSEKHLIALLHYIHQNPLHAGMVTKLEDWKYSSYRTYIKPVRSSILLDKCLLRTFRNVNEFIEHSNMIIE
jgi:REP element-mobilizing transposase RayT